MKQPSTSNCPLTPLQIQLNIDTVVEQKKAAEETLTGPSLLENFVLEWTAYVELIFKSQLIEQSGNPHLDELKLNELIKQHIDATERIYSLIEQADEEAFRTMKEAMARPELRPRQRNQQFQQNFGDLRVDKGTCFLNFESPNGQSQEQRFDHFDLAPKDNDCDADKTERKKSSSEQPPPLPMPLPAHPATPQFILSFPNQNNVNQQCNDAVEFPCLRGQNNQRLEFEMSQSEDSRSCHQHSKTP